MAEEQKWEHVPQPEVKLLKETADAAEKGLASVGRKIQHYRTQIALHYKYLWRTAVPILGLFMLIAVPILGSRILPNGHLWAEMWAIWTCFAGLPVIFVGIIGPASLDKYGPFDPCDCEKCKPAKTKDLR